MTPTNVDKPTFIFDERKNGSACFFWLFPCGVGSMLNQWFVEEKDHLRSHFTQK